jgi:hypothetical protein
MKRIILMIALTGVLLPVAPEPMEAATIQRACMKSDRKAANRRLCRSNADQRLAATIFRNPGKSQEIRQSDRVSHEKFWLRYKEFGAKAQQMCS